MKAIAQLLEAEVRQSFETETGPRGQTWPPLSKTTLALDQRGGIGGHGVALKGASLAGRKMLRGTGALMGGITPEHTKLHASVKVTGPARKYAGVHQFGNPDNKMPNGARAPIPARPFLPVRRQGGKSVPDLSEEAMADIRDILRRHVRGES